MASSSTPPTPYADMECDDEIIDDVHSPSLLEAIERTLAGKLISTMRPSAQQMQFWVSRAWNCPNRVEAFDLGRGIFSFSFLNKSDVKQAMEEGPWYIASGLLVVAPVSPNIPIDQMIFSHSNLWVRIHDLPPAAYSDKRYPINVGRALGSLNAMELLSLNPDALQTFNRLPLFRRYIRIRVRINILESLKKEHIIPACSTAGEHRGIPVRISYEHLPDICFRCGVIGHTLNICTVPEAPGPLLFGEWIRSERFGRIHGLINGQPRRFEAGSSSRGPNVSQQRRQQNVTRDLGINLEAGNSSSRPVKFPENQGDIIRSPRSNIPQLIRMSPASRAASPLARHHDSLKSATNVPIANMLPRPLGTAENLQSVLRRSNGMSGSTIMPGQRQQTVAPSVPFGPMSTSPPMQKLPSLNQSSADMINQSNALIQRSQSAIYQSRSTLSRSVSGILRNRPKNLALPDSAQEFQIGSFGQHSQWTSPNERRALAAAVTTSPLRNKNLLNDLEILRPEFSPFQLSDSRSILLSSSVTQAVPAPQNVTDTRGEATNAKRKADADQGPPKKIKSGPPPPSRTDKGKGIASPSCVSTGLETLAEAVISGSSDLDTTP